MKNLSFISVIVTVASILSLVLVLPFTGTPVFHTKLYLLFVVGLLLLGYYVYSSLKNGSLEYVVSPLTTVFGLFGISVAISSFFTRTYPQENFLDLGGALLATVVVVIIGSLFLYKKHLSTLISCLLIGSVIIVVDSLLQLLGIGSAQFLNWLLQATISNQLQFTLVGAPSVAFQVMLVSLCVIIITSLHNKAIHKHHLTALFFIVVGLGIYGWAMVAQPAGYIPSSPSFATSWSIALDSLKQPATAIFGIGSSNYQNAYSAFRPVWLNATENWGLPHTQAYNVPLTVLTTLGLAGLALWVLIVIMTVKEIPKTSSAGRTMLYILLSTHVIQLFFNFNFTILLFQAFVYAIYVGSQRERHTLISLGKLKTHILGKHSIIRSFESTTPLYITTSILTVLLVFLTYQIARTYQAYAVFYSAQVATRDIENDGILKSYEIHQRAIELNPYIDTFHRSYANINLLIAMAMANQEEVSDEETRQILQLLNQAIREAKASATLDPNDYENWVVLGQIYSEMASINPEAPQFAVDTYIRAIETNPTNPIIRILLGNVFRGQEDYQRAIIFYNQAIELKPDLAEAHFNVAQAWIALEQFQQAEASLRKTLTLLENGTDEFIAITSLLEEVEPKAQQERAQLEAQKLQPQNPPASTSPTVSPTPAPQQPAERRPTPEEAQPSFSEETPIGPPNNDIPATQLPQTLPEDISINE